ncbi:MAG: protein-export rane protein SecD, preprotein translocase subunit SecD, partial [Parcubacteria group bacterium]|nr:protein-export rane protein SecD, preprotein translocase subunit SecD [Parcubacteria group bacterium]
RPWRIISALIVLIVAALLAWFVVSTHHAGSKYNVKLGLDLAGGTELIYHADTTKITTDKQGALNSLRDVIDRRVNAFGVAEPLVQLEQSSAVAGNQEDRLLVELPGVTDVKAAVDAIGKTPVLEFKLAGAATSTPTTVGTTTSLSVSQSYIDTGLTGRYLQSAELQFATGNAGQVANSPTVVLHFNAEGAALFAKLTSENVGKTLAIFLDGNVISAPTIQEAIVGGDATITGTFTPQEGRDLVQNLNFGALPVPITLESSDTVGPSLGGQAYNAGLVAAAIGFGLVSLFMVIWYRLPGVIATVALVIYVLITITLIKIVPITLTASGIAGFILSIGLAVDANVLIFERMKEELRRGLGAQEAATIGFGRAWPAIRDGHLTMIISAIILFWVGTSLIKGFALVFGFGVITSLISAVFISRVFLRAILPTEGGSAWRFLLSSGFHLGSKDNDTK